MLRPAQINDAPTIAGWLSDPDVTRYLTSNLRGGALSAQLVQVALRRRDQAWYLFRDPDETGARPAGLIAVDSIDTVDGIGNLWFVLGDKGKRRRGLTSRAIGEFCVNNPLRLHVASAWAGEPNAASIACLRRAGFREVGRIPDAFVVDKGRFARVLFERQLGGS